MSRGEDVQQSEHWNWRTWACIAAITLACAAVFHGVLRNETLHWDDRYHLTDNPWFAAIDGESFAHFWREPYGNLYIPVAYNAFAAEVWATQQVSGIRDIERLDPALLQGVKVLLHIAVASMVFVMIRRMVKSDAAALAGALVFALHPLQAESVAWISETRGLLGAVFGLASVLAMERACLAANARPPTTLDAERSRLLRMSASASGIATCLAWWLIAAGLLSGALLAKPATVTIPLIGAAWLIAAGVAVKRAAICAAPLLVLSGAAVMITRIVQNAEVIGDSTAWWQRPLIAADAVCFYIAKIVWPTGLAPDYGRTPRNVLESWHGWWAWSTLAAVVVAVACGALAARRSRIAMASVTIFGLALLPVLGLSTFHHQAISTVADRYAYLALIGPAMLLAAALTRARPPIRKKMEWVAVGVMIIAFGVLSRRQVPHWGNDETLWLHAAAVNPASPVAHNNLGREYQRQGRISEAETHLVKALEIDPDSVLAMVNLGEVRSAQGRPAEAESLYRRAIGIAPRDVRALIDLGIVLAQTARDAEAGEVLKRALAIDPGQAEGRVNLAVLEMRAGRLDAAAAGLEEVLAKRPMHPQALYNLGLVRSAQGRWKEAAELWGRATAAGMYSLDMYLRRADAYVRAGMLDEAEHTYLESIGIDKAAYEPLNNLGLLYIRRGRIEDAVSAFERAAAIAPDAAEPRDNLAAARRLLEDRK